MFTGRTHVHTATTSERGDTKWGIRSEARRVGGSRPDVIHIHHNHVQIKIIYKHGVIKELKILNKTKNG